MGLYILGQEYIHIPRLISLHGPRRVIIVLLQETFKNSSSITFKVLSIISNCAHIPSSIILRQKIHAPIMQTIPRLMEFLENKIL